MFRKTLCVVLAGAGLIGLIGPVQAQYYVPHTSTHIDYIPHTTTHLDHVRHGNHYDLVPHTTTHLDAVPHTTTHLDVVPYSSRSLYYGSAYRPSVSMPHYSYRPSVRHTTTHLDVVPHGHHYHVVPHTTTHRHRQ